MTALQVAARSGHLEAVRYLVQLGADTGLKSNDGETAATLARMNCREQVTSFLKETSKFHPSVRLA